MFARVVADRYARALLNSCPDIVTIDRVDAELTLLEQTYVSSPETRAFFLNPKIPPKIKMKVIDEGFSNRFSPLLVNLIKILIEKNRQDLIPVISQRYNELTDDVRGVEQATIIVAKPLDPDLEERLKQSVQRFSTRQVDVKIKVDPKIMGGVEIKLGDKVIDGTLARRFEEIRRVMLAARVPPIASQQD